MDSLMQKLMMSKAIMDKSDTIGRGNAIPTNIQDTGYENTPQPKANYNIPQEYMTEAPVNRQTSSQPKTPTIDSIKNSKLPDEIKKLMIEHPINPVQQPQNVISNEIVEKATKMMKDQGMISDKKPQNFSGLDKNALQEMIESSVRKILTESGVIPSSEEPTNDVFQFKVGKHIFEGKVTKIKKSQ